MKILRFVTYSMLLGALYLATHPHLTVMPVGLSPAPYEVQAERLVAHLDLAKLVNGAHLAISGGLPEGSAWRHRPGPDFDVWSAVSGTENSRAVIGIYVGGFPNVEPPAEGLVPGSVGGIPVLWWQRRTNDYQTAWDALVPHRELGYIHIWIVSYSPARAAEVAERLKNVRFTAETLPAK